MNLLRGENLSKRFPERAIEAVRRVSLELASGQTMGILGESGSGKSTLARIILGLLKPDAGEVYFEDKSFSSFKKADWRYFRKNVQAVFQHPAQSLNPRMTVRQILEEPYQIHGLAGERISKKIENLLGSVELPARFLDRRPAQLSGGECQRVAIARALAPEPKLIVCDEAVSSLDLLVQAGILNLLLKLQTEKHVSYLFISHDAGVVRHMSDRILFMKNGSSRLFS